MWTNCKIKIKIKEINDYIFKNTICILKHKYGISIPVKNKSIGRKRSKIKRITDLIQNIVKLIILKDICVTGMGICF